ncbi:MAG: TerB family tellurite resistance protein [Acidobacteria bacterium]|nr:TerB family tellurite resistance protein [Acidobacteriota bacterium]
MLASIKRFFEDRVVTETARPAHEVREHGVRLAAAALLFEVIRADAEIKEEERTVARAAIQRTFGLEKNESDELMRLAEEESRGATSLYEFTHVIDKAFSPEEKKRVVELLWLVAFADAEKDAYEEHLVRRIAGLLHVPHSDFIDAKIRARAESESGTAEG